MLAILCVLLKNDSPDNGDQLSGLRTIKGIKKMDELKEYLDSLESSGVILGYVRDNIIRLAETKKDERESNSVTVDGYDDLLAVCSEYTWETEEPHSDNSETMEDYLENHLPDAYEVIEQNGTLAIIMKGKKIVVHASGNGDFTSHKVRFEDYSK